MGPIKTFAYVTAAKAPLYRAIVQAFMQAKERFVFLLRTHEVVDAVRSPGFRDAVDGAEIEAALAQLCEWGNLERRADAGAPGRLEDFLKQRYAFQLTEEGEAAELALTAFYSPTHHDAAFPGGALADIRHFVQELGQASAAPEMDRDQIHRNLLMLWARFQAVKSGAQALMRRLEQRLQLQEPEVRDLVRAGEQFASELTSTAEAVKENAARIEASGLERLFEAAAERDYPGAAPEDPAAACAEWRSRWLSFCTWFVSAPGHAANADILRERARASITALLGVIANINDRRIGRIDRFNDFRTLALWFAETGSDAEAHRLWRTVFGLSTARHLAINNETLDDYETQGIPSNTSWIEAPPLRIVSAGVNYRGGAQAGSLSRIVDRAAEKEKLAAAARDDAVLLLKAQSRFGSGRIRLSEVQKLEPAELDVLLDILGEAVAARVFADEPVEIVSADGAFRIRLESTADGREAVISTQQGGFSGADHWITIENIAVEKALA